MGWIRRGCEVNAKPYLCITGALAVIFPGLKSKGRFLQRSEIDTFETILN